MKDVLFGVLNWDRDPEKVREAIRMLPGSERHILVCTNQIQKWKEIGFNGQLIEADPSVAKSKNLILDQLKSTHQFCFIFEDDVKILKGDIISKYRGLMNEFDLGLINYGYHNHMNRVLDQKPNPCMIVNDGTGRELFFHRNPSSALMIVRNSDNMPRFDERLKCLETEFYFKDAYDKGQIPFNGFLMDVKESWKYIQRVPFDNVRKKTSQLAQEDVNVRGGKISLDNSADKVLEYVLENTI